MRYRCLVYHSWRGKVLQSVELRICPSNTAPHLVNPPTWDALGTHENTPESLLASEASGVRRLYCKAKSRPDASGRLTALTEALARAHNQLGVTFARLALPMSPACA